MSYQSFDLLKKLYFVRTGGSKEELHAMQSEEFVKENFDGSLPAFLAAFVSRQKLTQEEVSELQKLINENRR